MSQRPLSLDYYPLSVYCQVLQAQLQNVRHVLNFNEKVILEINDESIDNCDNFSYGQLNSSNYLSCTLQVLAALKPRGCHHDTVEFIKTIVLL